MVMQKQANNNNRKSRQRKEVILENAGSVCKSREEEIKLQKLFEIFIEVDKKLNLTK